MKDGSKLFAVAIGCGSWPGSGVPATCGNPTPIGGTFAGIYPGGVYPPSINDAGDVLFLADVYGGSSRRGLFLYRQATGDIIKVAALGDPTPIGPLVGLGPGTVNNRGEVVFLGGPIGANTEMALMHWRNGTIRVIVRPGDQVPGGRVFSLVWLGDLPPDGTYIPMGENPDINDAGEIAWYAILNNGSALGLYVTRNGVHEQYVVTGQPSPAGGAYFNFYAPILNEAGEIAFLGEYEFDPWLAGWFVGRPGRWRKVVSFYDRVAGGEVYGIAVSHNPQQPLNDDGDLIVWTDNRRADGTTFEAVHIGHSDGWLETIAKAGDSYPPNTFASFYAFPSLELRLAGVGAALTPSGGSAILGMVKPPLKVTGLTLGAPDPASGLLPVSWAPQPAASGSVLKHDVMRGLLSSFKESAQCAIAGVAGTGWSEPGAACPAAPGDGCWYLVRAEDGCGVGSYGAEQRVCLDACGGVPIPGCPICGNGTIEGAEVCDGTDVGIETCVSQGYDDGSLGCSAACELDLSGCTTICGDGHVRGSEECDGSNLRSRSCSSLGFGGGILACSPTCEFDTSACCCTDGTPGCPVCPVCGNGVREAPIEVCDGADLGGQTCWSQGRPPGVLACAQNCRLFDYSGCTGF